jgi:hypothetical protein
MEGRHQRDPGYDDWFDEPEPLTETSGRASRGVFEDDDEVWVLPEEEVRQRRRGGGRRGEVVVGGRTLTTTQIAILAASALAIIFAILAAAGVFSGGSNPTAAPVTAPTTPPPTVTPSTSTPTVTTQTAQAPSTTLSPGDTGAQVKVLQQALTALGFSPGKADGSYGPSTKAAVQSFQTANGLTADGVVGQQTLTALQQALSG